MSAKNEQRGYDVSMVLDLDYLGSLSIEKLKETSFSIKLQGSWGDSMRGWEWVTKPGALSQPCWRNKAGVMTGRDRMTITIQTGCTVRHSELHAFRSFMAEFVQKLASELPNLWVRAKLALESQWYEVACNSID